jgi:hypothetical protein
VAGHLGGHDVPVITIGDCHKRIGGFDTRIPQHVFIDRRSDDGATLEIGWQSPKRAGICVDNRDMMPSMVEQYRNARSDSSASHDDDIHRFSLLSRRISGGYTNGDYLAGSIFKDIVDGLTQSDFTVNCMIPRRHNDRVSAPFDRLVDNCGTRTSRLKKVGGNGCQFVVRAVHCELFGALQDHLAPIDLNGKLSIERH